MNSWFVSRKNETRGVSRVDPLLAAGKVFIDRSKKGIDRPRLDRGRGGTPRKPLGSDMLGELDVVFSVHAGKEENQGLENNIVFLPTVPGCGDFILLDVLKAR